MVTVIADGGTSSSVAKCPRPPVGVGSLVERHNLDVTRVVEVATGGSLKAR